ITSLYVSLLISFFLMLLLQPSSSLFPYTTLFRSDFPEPHALQPLRPAEVQDAVFFIPCVEHGSPIFSCCEVLRDSASRSRTPRRSEEHTSELQSPYDLVCRLLLEKKNNNTKYYSV